MIGLQFSALHLVGKADSARGCSRSEVVRRSDQDTAEVVESKIEGAEASTFAHQSSRDVVRCASSLKSDIVLLAG